MLLRIATGSTCEGNETNCEIQAKRSLLQITYFCIENLSGFVFTYKSHG